VASYEEIKRRARNAEPRVVAQRARWFLVGSIIVTLGLYYVPYGLLLGLPLLWLSTLVHELGHGFTAAMLGGNFDSFVMHADGSGVTTWSAGPLFGPIRRALVAAGGLVGPAIVAAIGFVIARKPKPAQVALLIGVFALVAIAVLVVRNPLGWAFVGGLALVTGVLATRKDPTIAQFTLVFLSTQLAMSVFSRGDYLFTEYAQTASGRMPSDVAHMADALVGPYWLWGGICGLFSVLVLGLGVWIFFRGFGDLRRLRERRLAKRRG
jgi:hypothetical protein